MTSIQSEVSSGAVFSFTPEEELMREEAACTIQRFYRSHRRSPSDRMKIIQAAIDHPLWFCKYRKIVSSKQQEKQEPLFLFHIRTINEIDYVIRSISSESDAWEDDVRLYLINIKKSVFPESNQRIALGTCCREGKLRSFAAVKIQTEKTPFSKKGDLEVTLLMSMYHGKPVFRGAGAALLQEVIRMSFLPLHERKGSFFLSSSFSARKFYEKMGMDHLGNDKEGLSIYRMNPKNIPRFLAKYGGRAIPLDSLIERIPYLLKSYPNLEKKVVRAWQQQFVIL